jgi:hypothetical protein
MTATMEEILGGSSGRDSRGINVYKIWLRWTTRKAYTEYRASRVLHLEGAKESGAIDYEVTEKRLQIVSWNIYCSLLKNITSKYRSIGVEFPWKPGDQEQKIIKLLP